MWDRSERFQGHGRSFRGQVAPRFDVHRIRDVWTQVEAMRARVSEHLDIDLHAGDIFSGHKNPVDAKGNGGDRHETDSAER